MSEQVELDSLVGEHELDAVDTYSESIKKFGNHFEDCNIIRFRLDGKVYTAIENPDDGHRSSMEGLFVSDSQPMTNVFQTVRVVGRKQVNGRYCVNDVLELVDSVTGEVVLTVGTENTDDYYPCFVGSFWPEAMVINQPAVTNGKHRGLKWSEVPADYLDWLSTGKHDMDADWRHCAKRELARRG